MRPTDRLTAEQRARVLIDTQLEAAGWAVQDGTALNVFAGPGVAVREVAMAPGHGRVDYLLYVGRRVVGVIEAKPVGTTLSGVEWQSAMYATGLPEAHRRRAVLVGDRLPFGLRDICQQRAGSSSRELAALLVSRRATVDLYVSRCCMVSTC